MQVDFGGFEYIKRFNSVWVMSFSDKLCRFVGSLEHVVLKGYKKGTFALRTVPQQERTVLTQVYGMGCKRGYNDSSRKQLSFCCAQITVKLNDTTAR